MKLGSLLGLLFVLLGCGAEPPAPTVSLSHGLVVGDRPLALRGVTVIDGLGNPPVPGQVVVLRSGRIEAVVAEVDFVPGNSVRVVDLAGRFVMPGLIDTHAHSGMG